MRIWRKTTYLWLPLVALISLCIPVELAAAPSAVMQRTTVPTPQINVQVLKKHVLDEADKGGLMVMGQSISSEMFEATQVSYVYGMDSELLEIAVVCRFYEPMKLVDYDGLVADAFTVSLDALGYVQAVKLSITQASVAN